jgi:cytochrome c oxidase cbb3-type subunit 2
MASDSNNNPHRKIEKNIFILLCFIVAVSAIGGMVEILPLFKKEISIEVVEGMRPYTPLELAGFNIYKREGCYNCHSQQIRRLAEDVERYGHYSLSAESMYDYPFAWGSKRTGPDLARIGEKYSDDWHIQHLYNPRSLVPQSIMPAYPFLLNSVLNTSEIQRNMEILKILGVPYTDDDIAKYMNDIEVQLGIENKQEMIDDFSKRYPGAKIRKFNNKSSIITDLDALIGHLQSIGRKVDLKSNKGIDW